MDNKNKKGDRVYFRECEFYLGGGLVGGEYLGEHPTLPGRVLVYAATAMWPDGAVQVVALSGLLTSEGKRCV